MTANTFIELDEEPALWRDLAACSYLDPDDMFRRDGEKTAEWRRRRKRALWACSQCPVKLQCAREGVDSGARHGIWGGFDMEDVFPVNKKGRH